MKLALGPLTYYWDRDATLAFYRGLVTSAIDIFYLGETVCAKRRELTPDDWIELGRELADQGKEVVLSTLSLIEAESELGLVKKICQQEEFLVEANDFSAIQYLQESNSPFVTGPSINIYNGRTLDFLAQRNLRRWVLPVELGRTTLAEIKDQSSAESEIEVIVYGHLPLAYSARCFTARAENLPKDDCQTACIKYSDGLPLYSQEQQLLFNINGIQTQSGERSHLIEEVPAMADLGVSVLRLYPRSDLSEMQAVIADYRRALDGEQVQLADEAEYCNGYWYGHAGMTGR